MDFLQMIYSLKEWRKTMWKEKNFSKGVFAIESVFLGVILLILAEMTFLYQALQRNRLHNEAVATAIFLAQKQFSLLELQNLTGNHSLGTAMTTVERNGLRFEIEHREESYEPKVKKIQVTVFWNRGMDTEGHRSFERLVLAHE